MKNPIRNLELLNEIAKKLNSVEFEALMEFHKLIERNAVAFYKMKSKKNKGEQNV